MKPDKTITPVNYKTAKLRLGDKDRVKLDRNTYLERRDDQTIAVRLHATDIVTYTPTYTELDSGGWHTMTTRARMDDYIPMMLTTAGAWSLFPMAEVDCHCVTLRRDISGGIAIRGDDGTVDCHSDYETLPGQELAFTGEWTGEPYDHDHGSRPVYIFRQCQGCQGTGRRMGHDWSSGGFVYFDGIRIKPDGSKLMAKQPRRPAKTGDPIRTRSGFTGRPMTGFGARSRG